MLSALDHPGIVRLIEVLDEGDDVVLVMPYLAGGSLPGRVRLGGPLAPRPWPGWPAGCWTPSPPPTARGWCIAT